jgi:hypothetical protein
VIDMDYELYHDESLEGGYWHGILLVPTWKKNEYIDLLSQARVNCKHQNKIGIKDVKRTGKIYDCASAWMQIGVACLRSKTNGKPEPVFLGLREKRKPIPGFVESYGMKFILFRETNSHHDLNGYSDYASKVETTFRIALKGGIHYFGSDKEPIHITRIHFDGYEHLRRNVDHRRIIERLDGLRSYCQIANHVGVIDDRHSNHDKPDSQSWEDCQFLQLSDILIGGFRTALGHGTREIHKELARPVKVLADKYAEGYARMRNSRWFNSFVMSQCYLENGRWVFSPLEMKEKVIQGKFNI